MMNETGFRRIPPDQSSGSGHTVVTPRHPSIIDPILSKRVCFYKSGDPQFNGLRMVINNRTFKTFDALLDSLSKKVPLPFGVRNITTPRGVHAVYTLDELEDGKSYICSDSRKVKPINLALARKKMPPWYHARPVSSRRRTVQQARLFPGRNTYKQEPVFVRTPKRLLVFRNGDPTVKHTVVLQKRTTPTFESILDYISELFHFQVVKFYTMDGRRVDGLPGLILCSGTVVAVGREPFRQANYNAQKSPVPTMLPIKQMGPRRLRSIKRKKKSLPYTSKARNFSPSSERYIVNRIHNSIAESSYDLPSHSVELESSRVLESLPETPDTCIDVGAEAVLPTDDDIEKSFRVNQDGSMTVEMRVRLTIKEEETVHWTTTLSRSSVANLLNASCLPEHEVQQENSSLDLSPAASIDTIKKDKTQDNNDEDPPSLSNGAFSDSGHEEDDIKLQEDVVSPRRAPTPGHKQIRKKQTSIESIQSVGAEGIQEGMVGSYSYREQTENGAVTEQYCMVKQSSTRPVPKPRRLGSMDSSNINRRNISKFKSAEMTEILQIESSGEEVTERFLHMYEQQTCQDNFFENLCSQEMTTTGIPFYRPATSETGQHSSPEFEPQFRRPSTASESISIWRAQSSSLASDLTLPSMRTGAFQATNTKKPLPNPAKGQPQERKKDKRLSKPKVINQRVRRLMSPGKRQKENTGEANKKSTKVKTFSSAGFIKKIYGTKSKSPKSMKKLKKRPTQNGDRSVTTMSSSQQSDDTMIHVLKDSNIPSVSKETNKKSNLHVVHNEVGQPRGVLTRQTSLHREKRESYDVGESMPLPAFNSSSAVSHEYVENWLEKAHQSTAANLNEEGIKLDVAADVQKENSRCEEPESRNGLMIDAEEFKCQTLKPDPLPVLRGSVKRRIQSFENKSSSPPMEKALVNQQMAQGPADICSSLAKVSTEEIKPVSNHNFSEIIPPTSETSTEMPSDREVENKSSSSIKISFQKATPSHTLSMELPLPSPPPPAEYPELSSTEHCLLDECSEASSPLYRISLVSSQSSDYHPLSISSTSDVSPTNHTAEKTISIQTDIPSTQREAPLPRTSSIKRAPLVSNTSLEREMSLRKACLDEYTLCNDATSETSTSSAPINMLGDNVLPNSICSTGTQRPSEIPPEEMHQSNSILKTSQSFGSSASPTSLTSEERMSPISLPSSEATSELLLKETKVAQSSTHSSPKPLVKRLVSSPSPERKTHTKKSSSGHLPNHPPDTTLSPNTGLQRHAALNASPSAERRIHKPRSQNRLSPYSQSLDMVSPPARHRSGGKMLSRNLSSDSASEPISKTQRKTPSQRKRHQTQLIKSTAEVENTPQTMIPKEADKSDENKVKAEPQKTDQEKSITHKMPQPLNITHQPNMKPVLEKICYSIKSIRQITQNKRPSCLEKSNSLPDFSSHVASTFGSSSKALLAFLSVMTLKEGLTLQNMDELNANNVSCAEALKMIDSLREIASMEDSQKLKVSLSNLQQSASKQLLESWKGFQELGEKCKSRSSTPNDSEQEIMIEASSEKGGGIDEKVIDEIVENLDIPDKLKEELASLSVDVVSDSDDEEKIEKVEPRDDSIAKFQSHFSTEEALNVRSDTPDEKVNVDVSSIIKKFTDINQPKQSSMGSKPQVTKDKDSLYLHNGVAICPPNEPTDKQSEEMQLYSSVFNNGTNEDKSNGEKVQINEIASCKESLEQHSCTAELEGKDIKGNQLQVQGEETILGNELTYDDESGSDEEGENMSSAIKDLEQNLSWKQSVSSSESGEHQSSEAEVECEEIRQESGASDELSNPESHSEEEEEKQPSLECNVKVDLRGTERISSPDSQDKSLSEEEQPEVECQTASLEPYVGVDETMYNSEDNDDDDDPSSEEGQFEVECQTGCIKPNDTVNQSQCISVDDPSSKPEVGSKELKVIIEESLSCTEEEEEEDFYKLPDQREQTKAVECRKLKVVREETEELSSDTEEPNADICQNAVKGDLSKLIDNEDLDTNKANGGLIKSDSLTKRFRLNTDEDSGNDHSSCDEHLEVERPKVGKEQISSSNEEFSFEEKDSSSEEEHAIMGRYIEKSCEYQEITPALATQFKSTECEKGLEKLKLQSEEIITQSVAERVILLEKQVAAAQKTTDATVHFSQRNAQRESDVEDSPSELPASQSAPGTRSAPQSSLSFSYDSSGVITTEPEGRVRSIREMFLAKSGTDIQHGYGGFPCAIESERSEIRAQTSASAGYQSQTSSELSSSEDDSSRKSIKKGFVRRTIERLYGKRDDKPDEEVSERPPSAPREKKREHSSIFSPFHIARSKAMELSYFHSTNALDTLASRVAFNAQVGPEDGIPIDNDQWLLRENTLIRKSVSDPVGINKKLTNSSQSEGMCEDTEENTYSFFSTKSELEDKKSSLSRKCTYFSLPHASDSDACQEELSTVSKGSANGDSTTDTKGNPEDANTRAERNGTLPGALVTEYRMMDNKVHPLVEHPPDGEVVAVQPGRGQGVMSRRMQDPDMLDILYDFCGQNCPIL